jgi:NADPH-dependent curcumin reductase CurA
MSNTEIHLASYPVGWPTLDNFTTVKTEIPTPGDGQILVRNLVMSVDPYMRGRMSTAKSYSAPFAIGEPLQGGAVGEVIESKDPKFAVGDVVLHFAGWREYAAIDAATATAVDPNAAPINAYLGALGMTGLTAWAGLLTIGEFKAGDVVFVSGAAGAVGQLVGQIAKLKGAKKVIGSAGSAEKVEHLTEVLGFDAAFNYKDGDVAGQLAKALDGEELDVYFDNVGGDHLEAAIGQMKVHGHIVVCGMISAYNSTEVNPAPRNLVQVIGKRLTMRGMLSTDHYPQAAEFMAEMGPWLASGQLHHAETVVDGIDNAASAFLGVLKGENTGKMLVKLAERS